jgi:hypothetical protein
VTPARTLLLILAFVTFVVVSFIAYVSGWQANAQEVVPLRVHQGVSL